MGAWFQSVSRFGRSRRPAAGRIRAFEARDLDPVVDLHHRVVSGSGSPAAAPSRASFERIFVDHPWSDHRLPSLVFEDDAGRIVGCLGVMPRPMFFRDREITAAISHNFIVEPGSRGTLAGMQLARAFLSGPQDLSMAEGSSASRRIWERAGGATSLLFGLCWTRPLQPARYALSVLGNRGLPGSLKRVLSPLCRAADALLPLVPGTPFRLSQPDVSAEVLEGDTMAGFVTEFSGRRALRPSYDARTAHWLLHTLEQGAARNVVHRVRLRNGSGESLGWYVYVMKPSGVAEVAQLGAVEDAAGTVLDHLFWHARKHGAIAVSGQVDPVLFPAFSDKHCFFHHDGRSWILIHSRHPDVLTAIHSGDACLTRLDGEWWISFLLG